MVHFTTHGSLIVFLAANRLPVPLKRPEQLAIGRHHLVEAANVSLHIAASANNFSDVVLNVPSQSAPVRSATAQRWHEMKIGVFSSQALELFTIIDVLFEARAKQQP